MWLRARRRSKCPEQHESSTQSYSNRRARPRRWQSTVRLERVLSKRDTHHRLYRPDQLILQDDPAFLPEYFLPGLDIDLSALDLSTDGSSRRSSLLSPHSQQSSRSSNKDSDESLLGLIIPTSDTGDAGNIGGFALAGDDIGSARRGSRIGALLEEEEGGLFPDVDFAFDEEGNVIEYGAEKHLNRAVPGGPSATRPRSDSAASARVRQEHEEGFQAGQLEVCFLLQVCLNVANVLQLGGAMDLNLDVDLPRYGDDYNFLPEAEPFPEMDPRAVPESGLLKSSSSVVLEEEPSSESAEAPQRRRPKAAKVLAMDVIQGLRNADLAQWNNEYLNNMIVAAQAKHQHKLPSQSKKNAAFWVVGSGIGGVGSGLGTSKIQSPLDMFAGAKLMEALTGVEGTAAGKKRTYSGEDDRSDSQERRVKAREADHAQVGRGDELALDDDGALPMFGDDNVSLQPLLPRSTTEHPIGCRNRSRCPTGPRRLFISDAMECYRFCPRFTARLFVSRARLC